MINQFENVLNVLTDKHLRKIIILLENYGGLIELTAYKKINYLKQLLELYDENGNGFKLEWSTDESREIGGSMEFPTMDHVMGDWSGVLFDDENIKENPMLQYFKIFDLISDTHSCGFLHEADFETDSIYYHISPESGLYSLDLDFNGYMEMAYEAKIFDYWPKVLLDIQSGNESPETKKFKEDMPKVFEDFNWNNFVVKYESIRLSKR